MKNCLLKAPKNVIGRELSKKEIDFIEMTDESLFLSSDFKNSIFYGIREIHGLTVKKEVIREKINSFFLWVESLNQYDDIYIIANSKKNEFNKITFKKNDLIVVFNRFAYEFIYEIDCDAVVFNRQVGKLKSVWSNEDCLDNNKIKRFIISDYFDYINTDDVCFFIKYDGIVCADFIPYSLDKRTVPSSGYTLLYIINHYFAGDASIKKFHPIGFQFTGLPCHDWEYEQISKEKLFFDWI